MSHVAFPLLLLTDKTLFSELAPLFANTARELAARKAPNAILIYEVCDAPEWAHAKVKPSDNPDRMLVMTFKAEARDVVARAVSIVGERLPQVSEKKKTSVTMKENTPLRNFFRQMAEVPLTAFALSHAKTPGSTLFFLRTPDVIAEFKKVLPEVLTQPAAVSPEASAAGKPATTAGETEAGKTNA